MGGVQCLSSFMEFLFNAQKSARSSAFRLTPEKSDMVKGKWSVIRALQARDYHKSPKLRMSLKLMTRYMKVGRLKQDRKRGQTVKILGLEFSFHCC
jgi:hypothetical protein